MRISDWSSDVCSSDLALLLMDEAVHEVDMLFGLDAEDAELFIQVMLQPDKAEVLSDEHKIEHGLDLLDLPWEYSTPGHFAFAGRSEEHTSELQSLMRSSYAVFCLKKKTCSQPR